MLIRDRAGRIAEKQVIFGHKEAQKIASWRCTLRRAYRRAGVVAGTPDTLVPFCGQPDWLRLDFDTPALPLSDHGARTYRRRRSSALRPPYGRSLLLSLDVAQASSLHRTRKQAGMPALLRVAVLSHLPGKSRAKCTRFLNSKSEARTEAAGDIRHFETK